ncbi:glycosyl transferase [Burkholderia multivorans]|nr:glycosyltransferase family 2 protein [Burkholderia multivorans]PRF36597.1 glycosyl transferase [Burkholderia multivorans]
MTSSTQPSFLLSISVVTFHPDPDLLERTLSTVLDGLVRLDGVRRETGCDMLAQLYVVDNGGTELPGVWAARFAETGTEFVVLRGHGNVGYGRGHNLAIERADSHFHLVLNPDVLSQPDALSSAIELMRRHADVGLVVPEVRDPQGEPQFLCRRYPNVFDLLLRGFAPQAIKRVFRRRLDRYEMHDAYGAAGEVWDPTIVSGCFMFYRSCILRALGGFDPRYFLYFEDYDLSLRTAKIARIVYSPQVRIVHFGGGAARKGWLHVKLFVVSAMRFYNRFGWRWL